MTAKEIQAIADGTKAYVEAEFERLAAPLIALDENVQRLQSENLVLARKLADVTLALVQADGALAERLGLVEEHLFPTPDHFEGNLGANIAGYEQLVAEKRYLGDVEPKRSWWSRFWDWLEGPDFYA